MDDDDYGDGQMSNDAALAALEAAERAHATSKAPSSSLSRVAAPSSASTHSTTAAALTTRLVGGISSSKLAVQQPVPQRVGRGGSSSIIVNTRQKGNPILTYIKNVSWEYGDIVPDYVVGQTTCALFLSLKYHRLHPEYIYNRIKTLGRQYNLRVLLVMVDIENHSDTLRELSKTSLINDLTLILAWTAPEAGRYLEAYKSFEHVSPTLIQEKQSNDYASRLVEVLTQIRSVNKVDAVSLVSNFGSVRAAINASPDEILMISGWGQRKVERFEKAVNEGFRVNKAMKSSTAKAAAVRRKNATSANVAAKLGIGPLTLPIPDKLRVENRDDWVIADDEDALIAVEEMEAEERRGKSKGKEVDRSQHETRDGRQEGEGGGGGGGGGGGLSAEVGTSIMDALAKLRERGG